MTELRKNSLIHSLEHVSQGSVESSVYKNFMITPADDRVLIDILVHEIKKGAMDDTLTVKFAHSASPLENASPE